MKKIVLNGLCLLIALLSGVSLFVLKYHVKAEEKQLRTIHREILQIKSEIHMLEAEWANLNDPQRLLALVESQTDWQKISSKQIISLSDIPLRPEKADTEEAEETKPVEQATTSQKTLLPIGKPTSSLAGWEVSKTEVTQKPVSSEKSNALKQVKEPIGSSKTAQPALNSLARNAKTLTQKPTGGALKKTPVKAGLTGTSQKDFVWSAPKKTQKQTYRPYRRVHY